MRFTSPTKKALLTALACLTAACGPHAHIPPRPVAVPGMLADSDSVAVLARRLAPVLYIQRDETFPLKRVVAVVHPTRRVIAYHLLWRDDVSGAWIPFTKPTDEEVVWVGYDSTLAPVEIWTYWHNTILHTDWKDRGTPLIDVQWGKHGSLPRGTDLADLPFPKKMPLFWLAMQASLPDIWLGDVFRKGPAGFFHGYARYKQFDRPTWVGTRIDAVVHARHAVPQLSAVFGRPYSKKREWPEMTPAERAAVKSASQAGH